MAAVAVAVRASARGGPRAGKRSGPAFGHLDAASQQMIAGWAKDPNYDGPVGSHIRVAHQGTHPIRRRAAEDRGTEDRGTHPISGRVGDAPAAGRTSLSDAFCSPRVCSLQSVGGRRSRLISPRRFLLSRRRAFCALGTLVGLRRGRGVSVASISSTNRSIAASLFIVWERCFWLEMWSSPSLLILVGRRCLTMAF